MGAHNGAPRFELADIVRDHRAELESVQRLTWEQRRVLQNITRCRTAALGGHLDVCEHCGYEHPSYNSCRDRHCPKCQALVQQMWIEQQRVRLVEALHFHAVFTLPAELRPLVAFAPRIMYAMLMAVVAATLLSFGRRRLRATIGATLVLHTWTKELHLHPHVHAVVTGGGLRRDGSWASTGKNFLFPVKAMSRVFRGKMRAALRKAYQANLFKDFADFQDPQAFDRLHKKIGAVNWYVYTKRSFDRAKHVVEYLGRYTHRVAVSNSRLVRVTKNAVVLRTRGQSRVVMAPVEFLRRFVKHVLPKGFHKIRHCGIYASPKLITQARAALGCSANPELRAPLTLRERFLLLTLRDIGACPRCDRTLIAYPLPSARAPPGDQPA